ncbi:hypothetical protein [Kaistella yonginensis]|uniref:hypothetical protein n=1 Tax=Kaistella yonginensis TaxID=658267 RepID=UPI0025B3F1F1|nr:hypothetical protein [Kaistella yonginensis]MDN3606406.1 hypothetical protein [Kaistella yonginensis]
MEEFAIVLPNGDVVLNKVNIGSQIRYLPYDRMDFNEIGRLSRFFLEESNTPFIALYTLNNSGQPFSCFFNEIEFNNLKGKNKTISTLEYPQHIFKGNFVYAEDGAAIKVNKKYIKNQESQDVNNHQLCTATYTLIYDHNEHSVFKDFPDRPIPFPANFDYEGNSNCLSPNDTLFKFYKIHASRKDALGQDINKNVLLDIAVLLERYRKTDGDFYKFLDENNLINTWNEQNISWADQSAISEFYEYSNQDFINYRNWLEKYYLNFKYYREKINALEDPDDKFFIAVSFFSEKVLMHLQIEEKLKILRVFCKKAITDWWSTAFQGGSREHIVLKVVKSIKLEQYNDFLDGLTKTTVDHISLYQKLYEKINGDNKKIFANTILKYWKDSKYSPYSPDGIYIESRMAQYTYNENTLFTLSYRSNEFLGIFKNNFDFKFSEDTSNIIAYTNKAPKIDADGNYIIHTKLDEFFGSYSVFQPVSLLDTNFDTTVKMPVLGSGNSQQLNSLIPIFYLKYIDDTNDWESFKNEVGVFLDVALTFSGIGNLAKLRHLRNMTRLAQVATFLAAANVSLDVVSLMFKFATDNCDNQQNEFCKKYQKYLFCLQMITGATDFFASYALRKSAKELVDSNIYPANFSNNYKLIIAKHAENAVEDLSGFLIKTRNKIRNRISLDDEFLNTHFTDTQIDELIQHGLYQKMNEREIEDFIFIACREKKLIHYNDLQQQMFAWKNIVEPRGYPFSFSNIQEFNFFKNKLKSIVNDWGLPVADIRVQGSSLRRANAKDVDIAIIIDESQLQQLKNMLFDRAKTLEFKGRSVEFNNYKLKLNKQINEGIIKNRQFGILEEKGKTFMQKCYSQDIVPFGGLNVSIIINGKSFDVSPYIKF